MRIVIILAACFGLSLGTIGWDGVEGVSVSGFKCLLNNGYKFFIASVQDSSGNQDYVGIQNIKNARAAGCENVDGYITVCFDCASAKAQVETTINKLRAQDVKFGMIWLNLQETKLQIDLPHNRKFLADMMEQLSVMGVDYGISTSYDFYKFLIGVDWTNASHAALWWTTGDETGSVGGQNFNGFTSFGGWSKPSIRQYSFSVNGPCGINTNQNWYPTAEFFQN